eukprot:gene13337-15684_t
MPGTAWFDITSLSVGGKEDQVNLEKNRAQINEIIQSEIKAGIPADRIMLGGFSQGAALSLYSAYQSDVKLAGCVMMSGFAPSTSLPQKMRPDNKSIPLAMFHGTADSVVQYQFGEMTFSLMQQAGIQGTFTPVAGLGHSINETAIQGIYAFIKKTLP